MFKIDDYLVYGKDVCQVKEIKKYHDEEYYLLIPVKDKSLKINIPVKNDKIRKLISKEEIDKLINNIPTIEILDINDKFIESEYKKLLLQGNHEDLIKIIKTTYLKNKERLDNKKETTDRDNNYFNKAEEILYTEFSIVLNMSYEDTKNYIINQVEKIITSK